MKKILMLGLITALCLTGCGSKPAESKTEPEETVEETTVEESEAESKSVDITGRELFSITVGDETLDLTTCTLEELYKLLQKAGIDTGVPGGTSKPYGHDLVYLNEERITIGCYNPYNEEKPWAQSRIDYFSIDEVDEKCRRISLLGGKIKIGEETLDQYATALDEYGIAYNTNAWLKATQVVNEYLQEGTMTIKDHSSNVIFEREIIIPSTMK